MATTLADTTEEINTIEAEIAALEGNIEAGYGAGGRGRGTKRGRSATKLEASSRPVRARKPSAVAAAVEPSPGFNLLSVKDKKKDLAEKIKQLERQIAKEAAETKLIKESDSEERKMQMQIEALQKKLEEARQAKEKALKKVQKTAELVKEPPPPVKATPVKSRGHKATATPVAPPAPVTPVAPADETTKQYCYCRKLWDQSVPMIGCDVCDEWYHLGCLNMVSSEAMCIESYVCVTCQQKKTKNKMKTQYKSDEVMAIEISQMPGELVAREIEVVKAELRELAGKDAEAIIAAIESPPPPPLEPLKPVDTPVSPATATSSVLPSTSSSSATVSSLSSSTTSSPLSSSASASQVVPETPAPEGGSTFPTSTATTVTDAATPIATTTEPTAAPTPPSATPATSALDPTTATTATTASVTPDTSSTATTTPGGTHTASPPAASPDASTSNTATSLADSPPPLENGVAEAVLESGPSIPTVAVAEPEILDEIVV